MADIIEFPGAPREDPREEPREPEETSLVDAINAISPDIAARMSEYWQCDVCASYYLQFVASRGLVCGGCGRLADELMEDSPHDCAS